MKFKTLALLAMVLISMNLSAQKPVQPGTHEQAPKVKTNKTEPVIILDEGKKLSVEELNQIDPDDIQSITVINKKNLESYVSQYGSRALNGVIFIQSKEFTAHKWYSIFATKNKTIAKIMEKPGFNYRDYKLYLNNQLLRTDFFNDLGNKIKPEDIKDIRFEKATQDGIRGSIFIETVREN